MGRHIVAATADDALAAHLDEIADELLESRGFIQSDAGAEGHAEILRDAAKRLRACKVVGIAASEACGIFAVCGNGAVFIYDPYAAAPCWRAAPSVPGTAQESGE